MRILLIGPPASGKGTVGEMLSKELNLPLVSVGALLRDLPESSPHFKEVDAAMDAGILAPGETTAKILQDELAKEAYSEGFILDGWMRDPFQKGFFDPKVDAALFINISDETAIKRISGRRLCEDNGKTYNIYTLPKEELKELEECENVVQRDDDKEEVVQTRLNLFHNDTMPVIEQLRQDGVLKEVDGEGLPQEVFDLALKALNQ